MKALISGKKIPNSLLGSLNETDFSKCNETDFRNALENDGYLFFRNIVNSDWIKTARNDAYER